MHGLIAKLLTSGFFGAFFVFAYKIIDPPPVDSPAIRVWTAKDLRRIASDDAILAVLASVRLKIAMDKM